MESLADLILNEPRRRHVIAQEQPYVSLGASSSPVTTEMMVAGRHLKSSAILMGVMAETWLTVLLSKVKGESIS